MEHFIKTKVAELLNINKDSIEVTERLMGGMSNLMYIIKIDGDKFTFRIPGKNANYFVNRDIELKNIKNIDNLNINSETIKFDINNGYKISKYIEGKCLVDVDYIEYLDEISNILKKIHNSDIKAVNDYNWLERLEKYENLVKNEGYLENREEYFRLKNILINDFSYFDNTNLVLCHGDSQVSNFVVSDKKVFLLDWEFCGNNDPYYDIACFGNKDFNYALKLLDVYLGRPAKVNEVKKLSYFRAFQCLQWHNVALYKHLIGLSDDLNVPFYSVSNMYIEKAEKFLEKAK